MAHRQQRLDGSSFIIERTAQVPYRTDYEGYERWRHQFRDKNGDKAEDMVAVHRLAVVAWFGFDVLDRSTVVHHQNCIPFDNRESNLAVMDRSKHSKIHNTTC